MGKRVAGADRGPRRFGAHARVDGAIGRPAVPGSGAGNIGAWPVGVDDRVPADFPPTGLDRFVFPPEHAVSLLPDPFGLRPPLAPLGSNEQDDPSRFFGPGRVAGPPGLLRSFEGILQTSNIPPDPILAAGPNHLMALVNRFFAIFTKDGSNLQQIYGPTWFNNVAPGNNAFDPKVIYDHFDDRWVMVWLAVDRDTLNPTSHILISVSDDSDPNGTWCNFATRGDLNGSTPAGFWSDYQGLDSMRTQSM